MSDYRELHHKYEFEVYPKRDVVLVRGKGAHVWDDEGIEYLDLAAGIGVASIGHGNEKLAEALKQQALNLITVPGIFYNDTRGKYLEKLISITPKSLTRAFLSNSGTEAMEAAIKFARFTTKKTDFIATMRGFHGRSLGALSATYKPDYRDDFMPLVPGFSHVPYNNFEKMEAAVTENTAGIILELIQGEGGINIADKEYVKQIRQLCDDKGILFIVDEIQSGFCRTGKMFACEHYDLQPDIMTVAKAIAGGVPMGATLCSDKINIELGKHGTTFGGNALAAAAGLATLEIMEEENLIQKAAENGDYFANKLREIKSDKIREVRNVGLMVGVELKEKVKPFLVELLKERVLALPAGLTVLRLMPPLVISREDLDIGVERIAKVLS
ncbi:MAG: acetylornithine/succinylornithine family transaminase [Bacteroidetes bacterium]|nr:acetylornithine/succinylornithine family transaminase [Bacteroidota bacterium]